MFIGSKTGSYNLIPEQTDNGSAKTSAKGGLSRQILHCIMKIENSAKTFSAAFTHRCIGGMRSAYNFLFAVENKSSGADKRADNANSAPMAVHNAAINKLTPLTPEDIDAAKVKLQATVNHFLTKDKKGFEQLVQATMVLVYSEASDRMTAYCKKNEKSVPKEYLHEIGAASVKNGLKCKDKYAEKNEEARQNGKEVSEQDEIFIPTGAGMHALISVFTGELFSRNVKASTDFDPIKQATDQIFATFDELAKQGHGQSPLPFRKELAQINKAWEEKLDSTESDC